MSNKQKLIDKIHSLRQKSKADGISDADIGQLLHKYSESVKLNSKSWCGCTNNRKFLFFAVFVPIVCSFVALAFHEDILALLIEERCLINNNVVVLELTRPAVSCDVCTKLDDVPMVDGATFSKEKFLKEFAYNGVPLLVKGGAKNWTALDTFTFKYLKDLYTETEGALKAVESDCQFFPYKTEFSTLEDMFNMSDARSSFAEGEKLWYVGWSNCHPEVMEELRKHYRRPNFLPDDSESSNLDWLFMGGFGGGADVHIDYVQRPSWQAMISGKKSWKIVPSPECEHVCKTLNATMETGDIILVDTNMWYHSTYIHPGKISITIGSEYD